MEKPTKYSNSDIVKHFLSMGINISPKALELLSLKSPKNHDLEDLIREISYYPGFKLHLTESILKQTKFFQGTNYSKEIPLVNIDTSDLDEEFPELSPEGNNSQKISNASDLANELVTPSSTPPNHDKEQPMKTISLIENEKKPIIQSSGISRFKPLAKEYAEQIQVLRDPNSDIYTDGSIDDFIAQYRDRFKRLKEILMQNPEVKSVMPINQVMGRHSSGDVNVIGMVVDKKVTHSGSINITIEDLNGDEIGVVVRNHERNLETFENMKYLLKDEVVFISGYLQVEYNSRVFFANKVIWPDIPLGNRAQIPSCPVSFALLSDLHIGSDNFLENVFTRFIRYLKGEVGTERDQQEAGMIKYLIMCGDLVDGIGIYADQENELEITDIYKQYEKATELFSQIPDYVKIIYIPGNHEPVRKAIPHPSVPTKYCKSFLDLGVTSLGDPSLVELHGIKFLLYHGDGMIDLNNNIPGFTHNDPTQSMREMLRCRHLSPTYGKECTEKAPSSYDWLVVDQIPHVFHTGHLHINGLGTYRNVLLVNSGCFQKQTKFMKSLGITPTPGRVPIISENYGKLKPTTLNLIDT